jgi:glycerol-3-phosphate dehydrogenase (NAD(P)+)
MSEKMNITVLGAGSWGITLARLLAENDHRVTLWELYPENADELLRTRESRRYLPGIRLPERISVETDIARALLDADMILFVVPSHGVREVARLAASSGDFSERTMVVNAAKGLEEHTLKRMSEVLQDELPLPEERILTIAGPSHAEEVSRGLPASVVVAGTDHARAQGIQAVFFRPYFRVYTNTDVVGVETAVALKNVIAIAAGVCDGLGYGDNTKAALLTRGLVEITRVGVALGGRVETFFGLSGIGDLVATSLSRHSRNRYVGEKIGRGMSLEDVLRGMVMVAEGVRTTRAAVELSRKYRVDMPITHAVYRVLFAGEDPRDAIDQLMNRPPQDEMRWAESGPLKGGRQ